jgi:hypothetical protein
MSFHRIADAPGEFCDGADASRPAIGLRITAARWAFKEMECCK